MVAKPSEDLAGKRSNLQSIVCELLGPFQAIEFQSRGGVGPKLSQLHCCFIDQLSRQVRAVPSQFGSGFNRSPHDQPVVIPIDVAEGEWGKGSGENSARLTVIRDSEKVILRELIARDAGMIVLFECGRAGAIEGQSNWTNDEVAVAANQVFRRKKIVQSDSVGERQAHLLAIRS